MGVPHAAVTQWQAAFLLDEAARGIEATPANALELAAALLPGGSLTPLTAEPYMTHYPRDLNSLQALARERSRYVILCGSPRLFESHRRP